MPVHVLGIVAALVPYGGLRVAITPQRLAVRLGVLGLPLLRLPLDQIAAVEVLSFNPLGDFGGWGVRYSFRKRMWGYFFANTRGVKIQTTAGKQYLIGSDHPEHLARVCEAARACGLHFVIAAGIIRPGTHPETRSGAELYARCRARSDGGRKSPAR